MTLVLFVVMEGFRVREGPACGDVGLVKLIHSMEELCEPAVIRPHE